MHELCPNSIERPTRFDCDRASCKTMLFAWLRQCWTSGVSRCETAASQRHSVRIGWKCVSVRGCERSWAPRFPKVTGNPPMTACRQRAWHASCEFGTDPNGPIQYLNQNEKSCFMNYLASPAHVLLVKSADVRSISEDPGTNTGNTPSSSSTRRKARRYVFARGGRGMLFPHTLAPVHR